MSFEVKALTEMGGVVLGIRGRERGLSSLKKKRSEHHLFFYDNILLMFLDSCLQNHRHNLLKITSNSITQHQGDRQCLGWRGQPYGRQLQVYSWADGWRPVGGERDC